MALEGAGLTRRKDPRPLPASFVIQRAHFSGFLVRKEVVE